MFWNFIENDWFSNNAFIIRCRDLISINFNAVVFIVKVASLCFFLLQFVLILLNQSIWPEWKTISSKFNLKLRLNGSSGTHCLWNHNRFRPVTLIQRHFELWNHIIFFHLIQSFSFIILETYNVSSLNFQGSSIHTFLYI